jgi:hypothetical protein
MPAKGLASNEKLWRIMAHQHTIPGICGIETQPSLRDRLAGRENGDFGDESGF